MFHLPLVRNFLHSVQLSDLVEGVDARRKTTMKAENLTFNNSSQREVIKELSEGFPHVGISIFPQTFIIKTIPIFILIFIYLNRGLRLSQMNVGMILTLE